MRGGNPERSALLSVRVWLEGDHPDAFRARITRVTDLGSDQAEIIVQSDVVQVCETVCAWLKEFSRS